MAGHRGTRTRAKVAVIVGTRPEAIKLAPLIKAFHAAPQLALTVINSGQHGEAVRHILGGFDIRCDIDLPPPGITPNLPHAVRKLRVSLSEALQSVRSDAVVVQGDTSSAYAGARTAHALGIRVAHVEAGLRTDNIADPFPEEWFRRRIARYACWHFAPCASAVANLVAEGIARDVVHAVGNTGIDTLRERIGRDGIALGAHITRNIVVTLHRRENWDRNAEYLCDALIALAARVPDFRLILPVHPNPRIARRLRRRLGAHRSFELVPPMDYPQFIRCVAQAALVISDSGGIQEEAPHLGTPLLVPRSNTERPECLDTGFVELVTGDADHLVNAALRMLARPRAAPLPFDDHAPFGSGDASQRIVGVLAAALAPADVHALH